MLFQTNNLTIRQITPQDAGHLVKWLSDPNVLQWYEGRDRPHTREMVEDTFYQKNGDPVQACIVLYEDQPVGYIQFYPLEAEDRDTYGYDEDEIIYGIDQFIGEPVYWNKGIGTELVTGIAEYLTSERGASKVVMDPQTRNERAIRCYEKCGFRKIKLMPAREMHEGVLRDCWLMEYNGKEEA